MSILDNKDRENFKNQFVGLIRQYNEQFKKVLLAKDKILIKLENENKRLKITMTSLEEFTEKLKKEEQRLSDLICTKEKQACDLETQNKRLMESLFKLEEEKQNLSEKVNKLEQQLNDTEKLNSRLLERAKLAEKFETAARFHKFLETIGKVPKLVDLVHHLENSNSDINSIISIISTHNKEIIDQEYPNLFQYIDEKRKPDPTVENLRKISQDIDDELNQVIKEETDKINKKKQEEERLKVENRFGRELYTEDDLIKVGNTPGNIANGGKCCIFGDKIYIRFKEDIAVEYNRFTGKQAITHKISQEPMMIVNKGKMLFRKGNKYKYYKFQQQPSGDSTAQMIYNGKLYFVNTGDGNRIYCLPLEEFSQVNMKDTCDSELYAINGGKKPIEACASALPVAENSFRDYRFAFSEDWMYYDSTRGLARINLKSNEFELIGRKAARVICTPKGVYYKAMNKKWLYYFPHINPKQLSVVIYGLDDFNLHRNKIIYSNGGNGLLMSNPDGKNPKKICTYAATDIYIIDDWVYFRSANTSSNSSPSDYYRVKVDGTGLSRLKEGEPLYVIS